MNDNLPFVIPTNQTNKTTKSGGKSYNYFGSPEEFGEHKKQRVNELNQIVASIKNEKPKIGNPEQLVFLDVTLDSKATSKSNIPVELFDSFGVDINKRVSPHELIVAGSADAISAMEKQIEDYQYVKQENDDGNYKNREAALLSSIAQISRVSSDKKVDFSKLKDDNNGILYFYKSISELDAKKISDDLVKTYSLKTEYLVSPSGAKVLAGVFSKGDVELIINDDYKNPFSRFEPMHRVGVVTKNLNTTYPITNAKILKDNANIVIGVIDGGIEQLDIFNGLIVGSEDYSSNPTSDRQHATMVASRLIFGNDIEDQLFDTDTITARAKVFDIKVMDGDTGPTPIKLVQYIEDAIVKHPEIKAYSMSVGLNDMCEHGKKSYLTRELDFLSHKYGVIFNFAAGNRDDFHTLTYPDVLFDPDSVINPPADTTNGFSVASLADKANRTSLAQVNEPSPFSRVGFDGIRKPDLAHYGGNARANGIWRDLGVKGLSVVQNELHEDIGTSHAVPLVSGEMAHMLNMVEGSGYANGVELVKALTIHSADYIPHDLSLIKPTDLDKIVGHGVPNHKRVLFADNTQVVYVYTGVIGGTNKKTGQKLAQQTISFTIPEELKSLQRTLNVRGTLAYFSPIDANDDIDPALVDVGFTLHKINSRTKLANSSKSDTSDYNYKPKWSTVKTFERTYSPRSYSNGQWEIRLSLQTRGDADIDDFEQPFALVVSIEDVGVKGERVNLQEVIRNQHKQYVRLNQLKVKQRVDATAA